MKKVSFIIVKESFKARSRDPPASVMEAARKTILVTWLEYCAVIGPELTVSFLIG